MNILQIRMNTMTQRHDLTQEEQMLLEKLTEHTHQLVARGGPAPLVGKYRLHYNQFDAGLFDRSPSWMPDGVDTYYPLAEE